MPHQGQGRAVPLRFHWQYLAAALRWLLQDASFVSLAFRKDCTFTPWSLAATAMLWVWHDDRSLVQRFGAVRKVTGLLPGVQGEVAKSYQAFGKLLDRWSTPLLEAFKAGMRRRIERRFRDRLRIGPWFALMVDGSRFDVARTASNEARFAPQSKLAKKARGKQARRRRPTQRLYNVVEDPTESNDLAAQMPDKLKALQDLFYAEAAKNNVLPMDNTTPARWNAPKPSLAGGRNEFTYSGELTGIPKSGAPNILNKAFTITAEVTIPEGGAEGMIVTEGGRFGGYGLFLSKGVEGIRRGKPVFIYNLLNLKRTIWAGPELDAGRHTIVFDYKPDEPGLGKSGKGVLSVDGREVARNPMEHGTPVTFPEDETFDIGSDTRTGIALLEYRYESPFKFTGQINKLTFKLEPESKPATEHKAELGPTAAPEPDPIEKPKQ